MARDEASVTQAAFWDRAAPTFDDAADHGLRDPAVAAAWRTLLLSVLPEPPGLVADLGCGTGSLACLLAGEGFTVHGIDLSPEMVDRARRKAATRRLSVTFDVGDAFEPPLAEAAFDAVLVRHVLWLAPDAPAAVARWARLLRPRGLVVLVEGRWHTGGGLAAADASSAAAAHLAEVTVRRLDDPALWGGPVSDERYLVVGRKPT